MPRTITAPLDKKKDLYRILNRDQCRDLRVRRDNIDPVGELTEEEWRTIKTLADTSDIRQRREEEKTKSEERQQMEDNYIRRKSEFERIEAEQDYDPIEDEVNREKAEISRELRSQVELETLENDDVVRYFNDSLNGALVRAVRDRQVLKKEQMKQLAEQEEFRVDNACQKDSNLGFAIGQQLEDHRKDEDVRYGALLRDQLRCKEEERMITRDTENAEGRRALQYARRLQQEEAEENIRMKREKKDFTRTLLAENEKALAYKKERRMHELRMDYARAQVNKQKMADEDKNEMEKKNEKKRKDLQYAEELSRQKRSTDLKAVEDEKRAQRAIFQSDRDWRLKETSKAIKQIRETEELKKIIDYQKELKLRKNAFDLEEDRETFNQTQKQLVAEASKAEAEKKVLLNRRRTDADELRKQIVQREKERWNKVQTDWETGRKLRQEMKVHDMKVQSYMNQKMSQAEAANIPHSYMVDVLRHMTVNGYLPKPDNPFQKLRNRDQVAKLIRHFS